MIYYALGSPRTIIRICKEIMDQQSELNPTADLLSKEAIFKGIDTFAVNFANETFDSATLRDLKKVRQVNFTVKHIYSDVLSSLNRLGSARFGNGRTPELWSGLVQSRKLKVNRVTYSH